MKKEPIKILVPHDVYDIFVQAAADMLTHAENGAETIKSLPKEPEGDAWLVDVSSLNPSHDDMAWMGKSWGKMEEQYAFATPSPEMKIRILDAAEKIAAEMLSADEYFLYGRAFPILRDRTKERHGLGTQQTDLK